MVRAPCCEKMGLNKGPWTPEEDRLLVGYIQQHGHENWRALPKQAGLLRCGKSCRLRWINYLRPDIKRGNFTEEEEETIIKLHELLGNRWSTIASKLPGRTDNEIKNVWHTHLKKRIGRTNQGAAQDHISKQHQQQNKKKKSAREDAKDGAGDGGVVNLQTSCSADHVTKEEVAMVSSSDFDDNLWADASLIDYGSVCSFPDVVDDDGADFWLQVFTEAGDLLELPCI